MAAHSHRAAPMITGPHYFAPCNLTPHETDSDIGDDDTHSVASTEYKPYNRTPRRVTFARGKDKNKCSYNPSKDKDTKEHPWPEFLDFDFYSTCNNGKVTDTFPWPDFLALEYFDQGTEQSYLREVYPPIEWKGKRTSYWETHEAHYARRAKYPDRGGPKYTQARERLKQKGDPWGD